MQCAHCGIEAQATHDWRVENGAHEIRILQLCSGCRVIFMLRRLQSQPGYETSNSAPSLFADRRKA